NDVKAIAVGTSVAVEPKNQILRRLDPTELMRLTPDLEDVSLNFKQVLWEPGDRLEYAYFVEHGVISLITVVNRNETVETGTIGNEGLAGLEVFLGNDRAQEQAVCQIAGAAKRMKAGILREERRQGRHLADLMLRYTSATMKMLAQTAACN